MVSEIGQKLSPFGGQLSSFGGMIAGPTQGTRKRPELIQRKTEPRRTCLSSCRRMISFRVRWVAPPSAAVLDHFEERRVAIPEPFRPRPWGTSASGASRMRLTRWRRRWGGRIAKLRPREVVSLDDMQNKAPLAYHSATPGAPGSFTVCPRPHLRTKGRTWFSLKRFRRYFIVHFRV